MEILSIFLLGDHLYVEVFFYYNMLGFILTGQLLFSISFCEGKSTMLESIGNRDIPIPPHIDIFHLKNEMEASDKTALQCVMEVDEERMRLEAEAAELTKLGDEGSER